MAECWTCGAERGRAVLCSTCGAPQPVLKNATYFEVLELEPKMRLDASQLEKAFRDLSRRVHPDRFSGRTALERKMAVEQTAYANLGYRTLKNPRTRAEYLLELKGRKVGKEEDRVKDMALLEEMLEARDEIMSASKPELEGVRARHVARKQALLEKLAGILDDGAGTLDDAEKALHEVRFLDRLLEDVDRRLEA